MLYDVNLQNFLPKYSLLFIKLQLIVPYCINPSLYGSKQEKSQITSSDIPLKRCSNVQNVPIFGALWPGVKPKNPKPLLAKYR